MNLRSSFEGDVPVPAVVLAEGEFGEPGGKTANGVVIHSELFDVRAVVDSTRAGETAEDVLDHPAASSVPVVDTVESALDASREASALVIGVDLPAANVYDDGGPETLLEAVHDVV